jgi:hypothetical protein
MSARFKKVPWPVVRYKMTQTQGGGLWGDFEAKGSIFSIMYNLKKHKAEADYFEIVSIETYNPEIIRELMNEGMLTSGVKIEFKGWNKKLPDDIELYLSLI